MVQRESDDALLKAQHAQHVDASSRILFPSLSRFLSCVSLLDSVSMTAPKTTIGDAFERLRLSISEEDAQKFACTELRDVWAVVREIDTFQRKRQCAQNLRRIEPLLKGIEKYSKVIEVLCNGTPFMPYAWVRHFQIPKFWLTTFQAPIKLALQVSIADD